MHKSLLLALILGAGAFSASAALPKVNIKKPAVKADVTGVKVTKPALEVSKPEGPSAADKLAEAKKNAEDSVTTAKQGIADKVNEVTDAATAAKDGADAKVNEAKAALDAVKSAATPTAPAKPSVEVTKPSATLDADGLHVTKPALQLKK